MANTSDLAFQPAFLNLVEPFTEPSLSRGVHDFIKELEGVGRLAQWSDQQTVDAIFARLRGKTLQFATRRLKPTDSFDTVKSNLIKEFTPAEAPLSSALAFLSAALQPGEKLSDLLHALLNLVQCSLSLLI